MNRLFNRGRKYKMLSLLMALAMLFSLLPTNTVLADTTVSGGDANEGIAVVSEEPAVVSEETTGTPTITGIIGHDGTTDVTANYSGSVAAITYTASANYSNFTLGVDGFDTSVYSTMTLDITPAHDGMLLRIEAYDSNSTRGKLRDHTAISGANRQSLTFEINNNMDGSTLSDLTSLKMYCDGNGKVTLDGTQTFIIHSVTFSGSGVEDVVIGTPDDGSSSGTDGEGEDGTGGESADGTGAGSDPADGVVDSITTFYCEDSTGFVMNAETGRAEYSSGTLRGRIDFTDGIVVEEGDVLTINYTTNMTDVKAVLAYAFSDKITMSSALPSSETETTFTYTLDAAAVAFFNDATNSGEDIRFKSSAGAAGQYFAVSSVTITRELPVEQPTVTINTSSSGYTFVENGDGYDVTYTCGTWNVIDVAISNPDPSTFTKLLIDVTPVAGMNMGILDNNQEYYRNHYGSGVFLTSDRVTLEYDLKANSTGFVIYCDATGNTLTGSQTFKLHSVRVVDPATLEEKPEPVIPSWQVNNGPTVTLDTTSSVFACTVNDDKSVDVSFTAPAGWTALRANVENCDYTKYSRVIIDITPAEGLYFYVYGDANGDISGKREFDDTKRTTIEFDLKQDTAYFDLWCNPQTGNGTDGQKTFTIHSIKIVDPTMPVGEYIDAVLSVQEGVFTQTATDTISGNAGDKMRGMIQLPLDFTVEAGKQLTFYYETNIIGIGVQLAYGYTSFNDNLNVELDETKNALTYTIDDNWVNFINNNTTGVKPTLRLKQDSITDDGYFTLKYVVYSDAEENKYLEGQVPKGLVVTYYNDIYSRGVAWNTDDTVTENALYVVEATDGMTAETVDWTDVEPVETSGPKATVDENSKTWHTFKAHVENLTPGAKYFYRAGHEETGWSEVGSFTVEKASEEITGFSFIHVTDSQEESQAGFQKWARILKDAYNRVPDAAFVAHTGDLVNNSAEDSTAVHMQEWIYCFDEPMTQLMNGVLAPSCGNHDCYDYAFTDRFDIEWADHKKETEDPTDHLLAGGCYTVTYGEPENGLVLITLANTAEAWDYDNDFILYQQKWLISQLEEYNDYKWKVVQMHEGIMTAGNHTTDGEVERMRDELPPIFAKYKVDLVLQGHDHVYTRTRSYAYGLNVFEDDGSYFDGHTPIWTATKKVTREVNGVERDIYLEPNGTHYVTINSCGTKLYNEEPEEKIDEVIFEGDNPINPTDENGNYGSMCQPGQTMYGVVTIDGDLLIYDSYTFNQNTRQSELYDTFAVDKTYIAGYDTENPNDGKDEVFLYGIKVETKTWDGYAPKLDITGFNASNPEIMDYTTFKYTITGTTDAGQSYSQSGKGDLFTGTNGKGIIPTEKGLYTLTVEIPQNHRYYYGSLVTGFAIN